MTIQRDLYFRYHAFNTPSFCHVRVLQGEGETVVVISEPAENSGPSITNTAGVLIPLLRGHLEREAILDRGEPVAWVEHYDRQSVYRRVDHRVRHSYAEVWVEEEGGAHWCHLGEGPAFLAERFNYPEECFEIPEERLLATVAGVLDLPIARPA